MMNKEPSTVSASLNQKRMLAYKAMAGAFSYPKEASRQEDYDRLFRAGEIWPYGAEHLSDNEFQRVNCLADIMGFYRAFGVEPDGDRPDFLAGELEFMYYLIFKEARTEGEKAALCRDAQRKFFSEHLFPAADKISEKIMGQDRKGYYGKKAAEMRSFLKSERNILAEQA